VYFEPTPLELLSGVVTERGLLDVSTVKEAVEALTQKYILAFQLPMKD
jgi:translation initiation factor 2B subunit (eIF-2B alpha/beta/delta family)